MRRIYIILLLTLYCSAMTAQNIALEQNLELKISELEIPPIISGCNPKKSAKKIYACLTKKFKARLNRRLQLSVFNSKNLSVGKHVIMSKFIISSNGEIIDIDVRNNNPKIVAEIKRALGTFKKFEPGTQDGKPVNVTYSFPLYIEVFK